VIEHQLIDHHCHGVIRRDLDRTGFELQLTEAGSVGPLGGSLFDSQIGFAVRRWCAPVLDLDPHAAPDVYVERRNELGHAEVTGRMLRAAGLEALCVDTGFEPEPLLSPAELGRAAGGSSYEIVRLEQVAEQVAAEILRGGSAGGGERSSGAGSSGDSGNSDQIGTGNSGNSASSGRSEKSGAGSSAASASSSASSGRNEESGTGNSGDSASSRRSEESGAGSSAGSSGDSASSSAGSSRNDQSGTGRVSGFADEVRARLAQRARMAVGFKSIAAYRHGLALSGERPTDAQVVAAADRWLSELDRQRVGEGVSAAPPIRLADETLHRFLIWCAVDLGLPVQFHVGYGDADVDLDRCDPLLLTRLLRAIEPTGVPVMLLHNYPFHRHAGYLAQVYSNVFVDVGLATHNLGRGSAAIIAEMLELAPFGKVLYSSDAFGLPELYYLGAQLFRRGLADFLRAGVESGDWTAVDAERVSRMICSQNARRAYRLDARANG